MRTIIELPQAQVDALDLMCRREGISRAEAIRRAIARHVREERRSADDPAFGLWRAHPVDGLAYQQRLRDEWSAPASVRQRPHRRRR
ncbi:MAG TPA: ribbon-helix-helix protein, CopG family [Vicinamibacterales bacterium]|nr:ribbon-helix-helix protein, CopG family [Vicinamibacterales bacterium]